MNCVSVGRTLPHRSLLVCAAIALLAGCAHRQPVAVASPVVAVPPPAPFTADRHAVLRCPGRVPVALEFGTGVMRIDGASARRTLRAADSSSGELYEDEGVRIWITGESALFEQPGGASPVECRVQAARDAWDSARRRGVALRAVGDGGRWWFEFLPEKWLLLATGSGEQRTMMVPVAPEPEGDGWRLLADDGRHRLELHATAGTCTDAAVGNPEDFRVSIRFDDAGFTGCGRWLSP